MPQLSDVHCLLNLIVSRLHATGSLPIIIHPPDASYCCRLLSQAGSERCILQQRHVKKALQAAAEGKQAQAEGFAKVLQNCQEVAVLGKTLGFALRPAIVSPLLTGCTRIRHGPSTVPSHGLQRWLRDGGACMASRAIMRMHKLREACGWWQGSWAYVKIETEGVKALDLSKRNFLIMKEQVIGEAQHAKESYK